MGKALAMDGKRKKVFLMTKNCDRDAKGTLQHLEDSLRRLQTDLIDLWQFHEINYDNDPDWVFEKGGLAGGARRPRRRARSASSASPATRTRTSTSRCSTSPRLGHGADADQSTVPVSPFPEAQRQPSPSRHVSLTPLAHLQTRAPPAPEEG